MVSLTKPVSRHHNHKPTQPGQANERCKHVSEASCTLCVSCQISQTSPKSRKAITYCGNRGKPEKLIFPTEASPDASAPLSLLSWAWAVGISEDGFPNISKVLSHQVPAPLPLHRNTTKPIWIFLWCGSRLSHGRAQQVPEHMTGLLSQEVQGRGLIPESSVCAAGLAVLVHSHLTPWRTRLSQRAKVAGQSPEWEFQAKGRGLFVASLMSAKRC